MTQQAENKSIHAVLELLAEQGFDGMAQAMTILMNEAMLIERSQHLGAAPYERTEDRTGYANGFKDKSLQTRVGAMHVKVPQTRDSDFYPQSLERGIRSERALLASLAELYVQGVSTRRVKKIVEELCGMEVSSTQVSRATQQLDEELTAWRERQLGAYAYVILDAQYQKVQQNNQVRDAAVLIAIGVCPEGHRDVLGISVSLSEAEVHWRSFLSSLQTRGLHGMQLITSDAHEGLAAARRAVFPSVPWQRCQFHLQQNAGQYVSSQSKRLTFGD